MSEIFEHIRIFDSLFASLGITDIGESECSTVSTIWTGGADIQQPDVVCRVLSGTDNLTTTDNLRTVSLLYVIFIPGAPPDRSNEESERRPNNKDIFYRALLLNVFKDFSEESRASE